MMEQHQRQIASISGTLEVLETIVVRLLKKEAHKSSLEAEALEEVLKSLQTQFPPENEFDAEWQKAKSNTVTRLRAHLKISDMVTDAAKNTSVGEA